MINRAQLKLEAKASMRGRKPSVYLVTLLYIAIGYVLSALSLRLVMPRISMDQLMLVYTDPDAFANMIMAGTMTRGVLSYILDAAIGLMSYVLAFGFSFFCLKISRGVKGEFGDLFEGFGLFFKVILLNIVEGIFISLWSLLFVIPGIVAAYRYSMALYILMDNPDAGVMDCIRESKRITQGHKGQLFVLSLSFIGWSILSSIPFVSLYTMPYMEVTTANYYKVLSGKYSFDVPFEDPTAQQPPQDRDPWDQ